MGDRNHKNKTIAISIDDVNAIARIGAWELDVKTGVYTLNKTACEILELPEFTKLKRNENNLLHTSDYSKDQIDTGINDLIERGIPFNREIELQTIKDTIIWVHAVAKASYKNSVCIKVHGIIQDITERKKHQDDLLNKNRLFNVVQRRAQLGYWQWDFKTNLISCSKNIYPMLGIAENTKISLGELLKDVHPDDLDSVHLNIEKSKKKKSFKNFSHRIIINGVIRYIKVSGKVITNKNGEITNILGISQDVTAQKKDENEILKRNHLLNFAEQISKIGNWQWNLTTNVVQWSPNLYRIFDHEVNSEITFDTYFNYVLVEDRPKVTAYMERLLKSKSFESIVHGIVSRDGTVKTVELLATAIAGPSGELVEMLGTCQDISQQRSEEIKFKGLLDSAPNATVIINESSTIHMINKQAEKLFGYTPEELVGQSIDMLVPSRFGEKRKQYKEAFLANQHVQNMDIGEDLHMMNKQGDEMPVQVTLGPLQTNDGLLISVAIRDITEERLAERKIIEAKERLEVLTEELQTQNHQLADFTQITSHNLRAPVSNLNTILEFYKLSESEDERAELFEKFEIVVEHLTLTLNSLIEALKTKNEESHERVAVSFTKTLKKTQEILIAQISKTGAIITGDFSQIDAIPYNQIYLESIFQNLIGNAIKYRHPDRTPKIVVSSEIKNGTISLKFKDNGLGINLKRHGHKLFGLNKVFHNHPEAKGVGLFMTKAQVEAMGGQITAQSEVDKGSTFSIEF